MNKIKSLNPILESIIVPVFWSYILALFINLLNELKKLKMVFYSCLDKRFTRAGEEPAYRCIKSGETVGRLND